MISRAHAMSAIGWLSSELATRAGAWDGSEPAWFPQPPEWIALWEKALAQTEGLAIEASPGLDEGIRRAQALRLACREAGSPVGPAAVTDAIRAVCDWGAGTFTCPRCGAVSHNPNDVRELYCGACHGFTGAEP